MEEIKTKVCSKFRVEKNVSEFHKNSTNKDGYNYQCKICRKNHYEENRDVVKKYKIKNKDKINSYMETYRKENKDKIKETTGKYWVKNKDNLILKGKKYKLDNADRLKEYDREFKEKYPEKVKKWSREYYLKNSMFETYAHQLSIEEDSIEGENGELLVRCSYCKEYFNPINRYVANRVNSLKGISSGEHRLYCSDKCKDDCDIYGAIKLPKSLRRKSKQSRCSQGAAKKILLQLQVDEFGYNFCDKCGEKFKPKDLIIHHNIPVADDLSEAENIAHYMLVCKDHHEHKGCLGNPYE